ncbi:DUF1643 domain-containing protein [Microbacterium algeriense]|uniref:DUF1643 domain-containing protein n=1 Tax=Microbacterium algeriense TaxID=2615184 RepID=UPI0034D42216
MVAVLLNPPSATAGVRSRNAVARAACAIGYESVVIANLCAVPTPTVVEVSSLDRPAWAAAQHNLGLAVDRADAILAGWGVSGLTGPARRLIDEQVEWLHARARNAGIDGFWTVGGQPRHPSRWHQYVSDKYGRTTGGTFEERIGQALTFVPLPGFEP